MLGLGRTAVKLFGGTVGTFARTVEEEDRSFDLDGCDALDVHLPLGRLTVVGEEHPQRVATRLEVRCSRPWGADHARRVARSLRWDEGRAEGRRRLGLEMPGDVSGVHVGLELRLPAHLALAASVTTGGLVVRGLEGDLDLAVQAGEVRLDLPRERYGTVRLDASVGDAVLRVGGRRVDGGGLLGRSAAWDGPGSSRVTAECGAGSIEADLR